MNTLKINRDPKAFAMKLIAFMVIAISLMLTANESSAQDASVFIRVGQDIQDIVDDHANGTTYVLEAGIHRLQSIRPDNGDTFIGEDGAILSGANVLTAFQRQNNYWVVNYQTQPGRRVHNHCNSGYSLCYYPEDLFIDNTPLLQVASLQNVVPGAWYFDYNAGRVYIADNPNGHIVEISDETNAFEGSASNVTIRNLIIEKYANPAQRGAIHGNETNNWVVENVTVQLTHGVGIRTGDNMQVLNSRFIYNGQMGMGGGGVDILIEGNEIAHNNWAGYHSPWEAGGTKFAQTRNLVVRNNYVHHNEGPGLWTDYDNHNALYEDNIIMYNQRNGIYHEIGGSAIIRNNIAKFNGLNNDNWLWGSQILVATSGNSQVYNNYVVVSSEIGNGIGVVAQNRGWDTSNNYVHDNTIVYMGNSGASGVVTDYNNASFWANSNNRFEDNIYYLLDRNYRHWEWRDRPRNISEMHDVGAELNARINIGTPDDAHIIPAWSNNLVSYPAIDTDHNTHTLNLLLFDATTDQPISGLVDGMTLDFAQLDTSEINIRANSVGDIDTVQFLLDNETLQANTLPFLAWGRDGGWSPANGNYTLTVTPMNGSEAGVSYTVSFTVINSSGTDQTDPTTVGSILGFELMDVDTQSSIGALEHNQTLNLAELSSPDLNILVNMDDEPFLSIEFTLNGHTRVENSAPYALWGDEAGYLSAWNPEPGSYTLVAIPYSGYDTTGIAGEAFTITFTVVDEVAGYQLITEIIGEGQVDVSPAQDRYSAGTDVELVAVPASGWEFVAWSSDTANESARYDTTMMRDSNHSVTIENDHTITAIFRQINATTGNGVGLTGYYYNDLNTTTPSVTRIDPTVNFNWVSNAPHANMDNESFRIVWEGMVEASYDGDFTFHTIADDGVRLWVGDQLIIDDWNDHRVSERQNVVHNMVAGQLYLIRLEYYDNRGKAEVRLEWSSNLQPRMIIPSAYLHPFITDGGGEPTVEAPTDEPSVEPTAISATAESEVTFDAGITGFALVDANNGLVITTLTDGMTINLHDLPTDDLSVVTYVDQTVGSVMMSVNDTNHIENGAPYSILGNEGNEYAEWSPTVGSYTIGATPYVNRHARGQQGIGAQITITIIDEAPATNTPLPTNTPAPTNTPLPTNTPVPAWTAEIASLTLINADNGNELFNLQNGMTINLYDLPDNISVIAQVSTNDVGSVVLVVDNNSRIENEAPYSLFSNTGSRHVAWSPTIGSYTIGATPYSTRNAGGQSGDGTQITINVVNQAPPTATPLPPTNTPAPVWSASVTSFTLVNADNGNTIRQLQNGATLNLRDLPTNLSVIAHTNPGTVGSVVMTVNNSSHIEETSPYSLLGNENNDFNNWNPTVGSYTISATPYARANASGNRGTTNTITINFVNQSAPAPQQPTNWSASVTHFNLINANSNQVIAQLTNGSVIDLSSLTTRDLNIQAAVSNNVGSVVINLNGGARTENSAPYSLAGDDNGNYMGWTPTAGVYTISATPYENVEGQGRMGTPNSITFTVVDAVRYSLNVQIQGGGLVTRNITQALYDQGTVVQLTAVPNSGWIFAGWSGDVNSTGTTLSVTMNTNKNVIATFVAEPMEVTIDPEIDYSGNGLVGEYYNNTNFSGTPTIRYDSNVDFLWNNAPIEGLGANSFTVRWTGWVMAQYSELYTFTTTSDDGVRLWVNGTLLFDDWTAHSLEENSGTILLEAGQIYNIRLEFFDDIGSAEVHLMWSSASQVQQVIPSAALFATRASLANDNTMPAFTPDSDPVVIIDRPVALQGLSVTATCVDTWTISNPNTTAMTYTWEATGSGVRSEIQTALSGDTILTTAEQGQESITLYYDLGDGLGEQSIIVLGVATDCP